MKKVLYFTKNYKFEFLTAVSALVLYFLAFRYAADPKTLLSLSITITILSLLAVIFLRLRDREFYFIPLAEREDKDDWFGRGKFDYFRPQKCFVITDSEPGFIYSRCLNWSDYNFNFKFKIVKSCLGVVVRAINLSNYVMLQIGENGIRPHIRINGGWRAWEAEETNLKFAKKLSLDKWYKCVLSCEKNSIGIKLYEDEKSIFNREWVIPPGAIIFEFKEEPEGRAVKIPFSINLEYGTVGFRNSGTERALIKDVLVEKI